GVDVATMMRSMSLAARPAASSAARAASAPMSLANTPSSAKWRARMPVRSMIHWSLVSVPLGASIATMTELVRRRGGRWLPVPVMREYALMRRESDGRNAATLADGRLGRQQRLGAGNALSHVVEQAAGGGIIRAGQGLLEGE